MIFVIEEAKLITMENETDICTIYLNGNISDECIIIMPLEFFKYLKVFKKG